MVGVQVNLSRAQLGHMYGREIWKRRNYP